MIDGKTGMILPVPARTRIYADPTDLRIGTYSSSIQIGDDTSGIAIPVTLNVVPNNLIIPNVADGNGWRTSITLVNTDKEPAPFTLKFRGQDGTPLLLPVTLAGTVSEYSDTIPAGGRLTIETLGMDSSLSQGWAELIPQRSVSGSAILHQATSNGEVTETVPVAPPFGKRFLLPFDNMDSIRTELTVVNGGASAAPVSLILRDENGVQVLSDSITLSAYSAHVFSLRDTYAQVINQRGTAEFASPSGNISAVGLECSVQGAITSFQPVIPQASGPDTMSRSISQVVDGHGWKTTFVLVNSGSKPAPFTIAFRDTRSGYAEPLPLSSVGNVPEYSDVIPTGSLRIVETEGASDMLARRWAEIVTSGSISGTVTFSQKQNNGFDSEASAQISAPPGDRFVIPFDNSAGLTVALAFLDDNDGDKLTTAILRDESGRWLTSEYLPLKAGASQTFFLSTRFPISDGIRGSIEFFGARFPMLGLQFSPQGSFASIAPISK